MQKQIQVENYFVIIVASVLLIIIFIVSFLAYQNSMPERVITTPTVTPVSITNAVPAVVNDPDAQSRLIDRINNRKKLSDYEYAAKDRILALQPQDKPWAPIYESPNFRIEYNKSNDIFMVWIMTTDIAKAKDEANIWFRDHGFSQDAICNYPVQFNLYFDVLNKLQNKNTVFSPVGNNC